MVANYLSLLLLTLTLSCHAGIYTWTDEKGVRQFSDKPPEPTQKHKVETIQVPQISTIGHREISADSLKYLDKHTKARGKKRSVLMYSAEWCGVCKKAKSYFRRKGISFREKDIDRSKQARKEFEKLGGRGIPLIFVGNKRLAGFSVQSFQQLYQTP